MKNLTLLKLIGIRKIELNKIEMFNHVKYG